MPKQRYFAWDEDVAIPFHENDIGQRVVTGDALIDMVASIIWHQQHPDESPLGPLPTKQVVSSINELLKGYEPENDEAVLPDWSLDQPECDEDGRDL